MRRVVICTAVLDARLLELGRPCRLLQLGEQFNLRYMVLHLLLLSLVLLMQRLKRWVANKIRLHVEVLLAIHDVVCGGLERTIGLEGLSIISSSILVAWHGHLPSFLRLLRYLTIIVVHHWRCAPLTLLLLIVVVDVIGHLISLLVEEIW